MIFKMLIRLKLKKPTTTKDTNSQKIAKNPRHELNTLKNHIDPKQNMKF